MPGQRLGQPRRAGPAAQLRPAYSASQPSQTVRWHQLRRTAHWPAQRNRTFSINAGLAARGLSGTGSIY